MLQSRKVAPFSIAFFLLCCASSLWPLCERLQGTLHWKKIYWSFFFACEQRAVAYLGSFPDKTASSSCDNPGPVQIQPLTKQSLSEGVCVLSLRHSAIQGVSWTPVSRGEQQQREQAGTSSPAKDKCLLVLPPLLALGSVLLSQQDCVHSTHVNCSRTEILHILGSWSIISWVSTHFFHAENGPVHFWNISKIRSRIKHKSFLICLVRYTKYMCVNIYIYDLYILICQIYLAYLAASSSNYPGKPIFGTGFFSAPVCVLSCVFFLIHLTSFLLCWSLHQGFYSNFSKPLRPKISSHIF